jgi:methionyl-tRNA formyltransferase
MAPDLIVVIAFKILPPKLYKLPRQGSINIHASLLPKYRGAAPINWALINGEIETGLTAFFLEKKVDTGEVIHQKKVEILSTDNFDSLHDRLSEAAGPFLLEALELVESGSMELIKQDNSAATPAPRITPFDAMIDFGFPADKVRNFVRGLSTRPGAFTFFRRRKLKILACEVADGTGSGAPGSLQVTGKQLLVQCAGSRIEVTQLVPAGKKPMTGEAFINGFRPTDEERFGEAPSPVEEER